MNAIRMRTIRHRSWSLLVVALGLAVAAGSAVGQPKKDTKPADKKGAPKAAVRAAPTRALK